MCRYSQLRKQCVGTPGGGAPKSQNDVNPASCNNISKSTSWNDFINRMVFLYRQLYEL